MKIAIVAAMKEELHPFSSLPGKSGAERLIRLLSPRSLYLVQSESSKGGLLKLVYEDRPASSIRGQREALIQTSLWPTSSFLPEIRL